jgi:two-component system KDP operon response regulator KdpE
VRSAIVIDDELSIRRLLHVSLEKQGYMVHEAATATEGLQLAAEMKPDIVLLDLNLPDRDGSEVLAELRASSSIPVIILSARSAEEDIVRLLENGADDYLTKPFNTRELLARMNVAIRQRASTTTSEPFISGHLSVDLPLRLVSVAGSPVKLTPREHGLMHILIAHAGQVVTHRQLLSHVWDIEDEKKTGRLRVAVAGLRRKIERNSGTPELLLTEPGVGYRLVVLPASHEHDAGEAAIK